MDEQRVDEQRVDEQRVDDGDHPAPEADPVVTGGSPAGGGLAQAAEAGGGADLGGGEGGIDAGTDQTEP